MKILTITIPSYNVEAYLPETLPTMLQPEILDQIEILIVNDGSKDRTAELAGAFQAQYPNTVRAINKENGGHGSTINTGIAHASGKYFRVIDGDDWVNPEAFVAYVKKLESTDTDCVLTPFRRVYMDTGTEEVKSFAGVPFGEPLQFDEIVDRLDDYYSIHAATFKTEILRNIPRISEHCFYVDQEYVCYPVPYLQTVTFLDQIVYQYRCGNPQQSVSSQNLIKNRNMNRRVTNHILRYYRAAETTAAKSRLLRRKSTGMIAYQLKIFFRMPICRGTKQEIRAFLKETVEGDPALYREVPGLAIQLYRMSRGLLYPLAALLWKVKNRG